MRNAIEGFMTFTILKQVYLIIAAVAQWVRVGPASGDSRDRPKS